MTAQSCILLSATEDALSKVMPPPQRETAFSDRSVWATVSWVFCLNSGQDRIRLAKASISKASASQFNFSHYQALLLLFPSFPSGEHALINHLRSKQSSLENVTQDRDRQGFIKARGRFVSVSEQVSCVDWVRLEGKNENGLKEKNRA